MAAQVVYVGGPGDIATVGEAIRGAVDGDTIRLRIGTYDEVLVLDKALTVEPADDGVELSDIVITGGAIATVDAVLRRITFTQMVDVRGGALQLQECDISQGADGVRVQSGASAAITRCVIHGAQAGGDGVYFQAGAAGRVEDSEIHSNRVNGVHVNGSEDVVLLRNKIHGSPFGVYFRHNGRGTVEGNTIEDMRFTGVYITSGSSPVVHGNTIDRCALHGLMISDGAAGTVKDNTVSGSVRILRGCAPTLGVNAVAGRVDNENAPPPPPPVESTRPGTSPRRQSTPRRSVRR